MMALNTPDTVTNSAETSWSGPIETTGFGKGRGGRRRGDDLSVDERSALCLLALARDLLAKDHKAVATMIDYAMVEVAQGVDR